MIILIGLSASASLLPGPGSAGRCLIKCWYKDHIWWSRSYLKTSRWTQSCIQSIIYQKSLVSLSHKYQSNPNQAISQTWVWSEYHPVDYSRNQQAKPIQVQVQVQSSMWNLEKFPPVQASTSIVRYIPNIKIEPFAALCPPITCWQKRLRLKMQSNFVSHQEWQFIRNAI